MMWALLIIAVLILVALVIYLYFTYKGTLTQHSSPWTLIEPDKIVSWNDFKWDLSPNLLIFKHRATKGYTIEDHLGVRTLKHGELLNVIAPSPQPTYWEFDIYKYPQMKLMHSIPCRKEATIGGSIYPLNAGKYLILMRTSGDMQIPLPVNGGGGIFPTKAESPYIQYDLGDPSKLNTETYGEAHKVFRDIEKQLNEYGYRLSSTDKSSKLDINPASRYIHREQLSVNLDSNQALLLVYASRSKPSSITVYNNGKWESLTANEAMNHHIMYTDTLSEISVIEYIYGSTHEDDFMPIYRYTFSKNE